MTLDAELNINIECYKPELSDVLCEKEPSDTSRRVVSVNGSGQSPPDGVYVTCPGGHYTHQFLVCDVRSHCWSRDYLSPCKSPLTSLSPFFSCTGDAGRVPYTLVCDHRHDCLDGSDEAFCSAKPCDEKHQFVCDNRQCIERSKECDGWHDCSNGEDEGLCIIKLTTILRSTKAPPALVRVSNAGLLVVEPLSSTVSMKQAVCPSSHFQCLDNGYCLPVFLRCNGVFDCPSKEDETNCDTCPGFYRCRASQICVHYKDLCDGHVHCPQHDDEVVCDLVCPPSCVCRGLAFFCTLSFNASAYPLLRYLDASGSGMTPGRLTENRMLIHLSLAECGLTSLQRLGLPNLISLDIHGNNLISISRVNLGGVTNLRHLSLADNPLVLDFQNVGCVRSFRYIEKLDLSRVLLPVLNITALSVFTKLRMLNLSACGVRRVQGEGFGRLEQLRVIDLQGCPITWFPRGLFQGLTNLQAVYAHTFKACCPAVLPMNFNLHQCFAPTDDISSCDNLLRGNGYSVSVFVLAVLSFTGNAISFIFRTFVSKRETRLGYGNFVTHLSVSDLLMGVYLTIIGGADQVYRGTYLWNEMAWKYSYTCRLAGFLSLLSNEVSALIVCLITMDRFLVLRFPFSRLHFSPMSAHTASVVVWSVGVVLALVPLLPFTSHWEFYSQTGICIPLPVTGPNFAGYNYSFGIVIVFNFVVFVFISMGQLIIYMSVLSNSMSVSNSTKKTKDLSIARRLITVAMTDFLCWFPIGVLGLMASNGFPIPSEVNVAVAIFALPLNSAVNPCVYTFNVIMERRSRAREEKLRKFLLAQLKTGN